MSSSVNAAATRVRSDGSALIARYGFVFTNTVASQVPASVSISSAGHVAALCDGADNAPICHVQVPHEIAGMT